MISKLRGFSSYKPDEQDEAMSEQFRELAKKFGRAKAEMGIVNAITDRNRENRQFVPEPAAFLEYVERADPNYRPKFGPAKQDCKLCDGTGWKYLGNLTVTECDCRRL